MTDYAAVDMIVDASQNVALLFFIYLREFADLRGWRLTAATAVMAIIIAVLAPISGRVGLKMPIL